MAVNPMMESVMSAGVHAMNVALQGVRGAAQEVAERNTAASSGFAVQVSVQPLRIARKHFCSVRLGFGVALGFRV